MRSGAGRAFWAEEGHCGNCSSTAACEKPQRCDAGAQRQMGGCCRDPGERQLGHASGCGAELVGSPRALGPLLRKKPQNVPVGWLRGRRGRTAGRQQEVGRGLDHGGQRGRGQRAECSQPQGVGGHLGGRSRQRRGGAGQCSGGGRGVCEGGSEEAAAWWEEVLNQQALAAWRLTLGRNPLGPTPSPPHRPRLRNPRGRRNGGSGE